MDHIFDIPALNEVLPLAGFSHLLLRSLSNLWTTELPSEEMLCNLIKLSLNTLTTEA